MVNPNDFFDFWGILQNEVIGSVFLFIVIGSIVILLLTLRFNMPYQVSLMLVGLWWVIAYAALGDAYLILWAGLVLAIFIFFFNNVRKLFTRS